MESNNDQNETAKEQSASDLSFQMEQLLLTPENLRQFSAEKIRSSVSATHDFSLLGLALESSLHQPIIQEVFAERYASKYFIIDAAAYKNQAQYFELFKVFGNSIKAIEVNDIRNIDDTNNHWLVQLLNKHTSNLEKLCFVKCSFKSIDDFLSKHINITHYGAFRGGTRFNNYSIQLPEYRNLKSLEIVNFSHISKSSLEQVLSSNPKLERLILKSSGGYFRLADLIVLIHHGSENLKELNLSDCPSWDWDSLLISLDRFVSGLKCLESFGMSGNTDRDRGLLRRVSSSCKNVKHLEINISYGYYMNIGVTESVRIICSFEEIETLSLLNLTLQEPLETIIESLPNLRWLFIPNRTNDQILALLRKCKSKHLKKLVIVGEKSNYDINLHFHDEFIKVIPNPEFVLELEEYGEAIGIVTKEEIIWRNKLLHWTGYDAVHNRSNLRLLNLATVPKGSTGKHKQPINLILNYLDLNSLSAFSMASKESSQLIHKYVQQRCKQSTKKHAKLRLIDRENFYYTDEFITNYDALRKFKSCIRYLDVNLFNFHGNQALLKEIEKYCKFLTKLCFRTRHRIDPENFILPQIKHFIFYGYGLSEEYIFHCDLRRLSQKCPQLETFEIKTVARLYSNFDKKKIAFQNLKTIKYKPFDASNIDYAIEVFKNSGTELIIDSS